MQLSDIRVGSFVWAVGSDSFGPVEVLSVEHATDRMVAFTGGSENEPVDCLVTADDLASLRMAPDSWKRVHVGDRLAVVLLDGPSVVQSVVACIGDGESDNVRLDLWAASEVGDVQDLGSWLMNRASARIEVPAGSELAFGMMRVYVVQPYMNAYVGRNTFSCVEYRIGRTHGWTALGRLGTPSEAEELAMAEREESISAKNRRRAEEIKANAQGRPQTRLKKRRQDSPSTNGR